MAKRTAAATPSFSQAIQELEQILARIEKEEVDIDQLAQELGRAAELIELCRSKLQRAEVEVAQIVERLDPGGGTAA